MTSAGRLFRGTHAQSPASSRDQIFAVLSNRRRRWVVQYLSARETDRASLRSLVDTIASWECDQPAAELSWKERKRVYTALRQSHLPKLDDAGVIEYDADRGEIILTDDAEAYRLYLEYVPENDIPWSHCYVGLAGVAALITLLAWLSVVPFVTLPRLWLATILVVMFGVTALAHAHTTRQSQLEGTGEPP